MVGIVQEGRCIVIVDWVVIFMFDVDFLMEIMDVWEMQFEGFDVLVFWVLGYGIDVMVYVFGDWSVFDVFVKMVGEVMLVV